MGANAAPGALELVRAFANTLDVEEGSDALATTEGLAAWLAAHDLPGGAQVGDDDLSRAAALRDAFRRLALANAGHADPSSALAAVNDIAAGCRLVVHLRADGAALQPAGAGMDAALGRLLAIAYDALRDGTWSRLKACVNDECQWLFYDRSKNRSGKWCTMSACGDVVNARAYRARRRA